MRFRLDFFLLLAGVSVHGVAADQPMLPVEVVRELKATLKRYECIKLRATSSSVYFNRGNTPPMNEGRSRTLLRIARAENCAVLSNKVRTIRDGVTAAIIQNDLVQLANGDVLNWQAKLNDNYDQILGDNIELGVMLHSKRLSGVQTLDRSNMWNGLNDNGIVLWMIGYSPLETYLQEDSSIELKPTADGVTIVTECEYGVLTAALVQSNGWLPKSFQLRKNPHHHTVGGLVSDVYKGEVKYILWRGQVSKWNSAANQQASPSNLDIERVTMWNAGGSSTSKTKITVGEAMFNPVLSDLDLRTDIVFPVGKSVTVADARHLAYEWDGTQPVPRVRSVGEAIGTVTKSTTSWWLSKKGLLVINVIILAILVTVLVRRASNASS